jgi:hypothetical protein
LVSLIVEKVLNESDDTYNKYDIENMAVLDHGEYQGTQVFIIPKYKYQPNAYDYIITYAYYGSCSGCDTLQGINDYSNGIPNEEQIDDYMTLCLHLIQRMKPLYEK